MFCDQCGAPLPAGSPACPRCGATLAELPAPGEAALVPPQPAPPVVSPPGSYVSPPGVPLPQLPTPGPPETRAQLEARTRLAARLRYALPGSAPPLSAWLSAMTMRNVAGSIAGMIGAWFNVPMIVFVAGVGAVAGGLAGVVSGTGLSNGVLSRINAFFRFVFPLPVDVQDLLPTAAAQIGGIIGGILGAINGALWLGWWAAVYPWRLLYEGDPMWPLMVAVGQVVVALFVAALYTGWSSLTEASRLRVGGARRLSRREAEWLMPIVAEAGARLGMRALPRVLLDDRRTPNAQTFIHHVVINQGLIEQLRYDREQIGAVIAHELAHWREGYGVTLAWSKGIALPLYLLYSLAVRAIRASRWRPLSFVLRVLFWSIIVTTRYGVIPLQARTWRNAEYRADAAAAEAGYTEGLRQALGYIRHSLDGERGGWDAAILTTHPPTELRLERLEVPQRRYPLREDQLLVRALPGWSPEVSTVERDPL